MEECLPKVIGADTEVGNFLLGIDSPSGTADQAARLLLAQIDGIMPERDLIGYCASAQRLLPGIAAGTLGYDPTDFGRKYQTNGGVAYIDSSHLELATQETTNAWDFTAAFNAQLMNLRKAQQQVNQNLPPGTSVQVLICNSDGRVSWGSHLNFLITRRAFDNIFGRKMHHLLWLASYQASSVIISGQGKVGSDRAGFQVDYQLSQRADFFEEIVNPNTMARRPIINSRDESHCFPPSEFARFHHIANDSNLCQVANLLKTGILQILLAMCESESEFLCSSALMESPLEAWHTYSYDPSLKAYSRTIDGEKMSAVDMQRRYFDSASRFYAAGGCDGIVPKALDILAIWAETLDLLASRDFERLSGRLDWVLKKRLLEEAFSSTPGIGWESAEARYLDMMYGNLDEEKGLFWTCAANGVVEQIVSPALIERYMTEPPDDTRAYTRGRLIKEAVDYRVEAANWDSMSLRSNAAGSRGALTTIYMDTPLGRTRNESSQLFRNGPISAGQLPARTGAGAIANQLGKENLPPNFMKAPNIYHVKKKRQLPPHVEIVDQILD